MTARLHGRLLAAAAALTLAGCGPTGSPDGVARDAGSTTASKTTSMVEATGTKARVAVLRQQFRVPVVPPNLHLPGRALPDRATTRPVIGPSIATGFRVVGADDVRPELPDGAKRAVLKSATVTLPTRADGTTRIEDDTSHVAVAFTLRGATSAAVSTAKGIAVYSHALPDADVVHRPGAEGTEDYVAFDHAPAREELVYDVDVARVAGLRLVANALEFLDKDGAPRLRVAPPVVIDKEGKSHAGTIAVEGCTFDTSPRAPWGRPVTAPRAASCGVRVTWTGIVYPAMVDPKWVATGSMATAREYHTASVLGSGKILVAGGYGTGGPSADLYDPASGTFSATGSMTTVRGLHTANLLGSGEVLIAGGTTGAPLSSAELYDPASGTFRPTGSMATARLGHSGSLLSSGKVLVAGGLSGTYSSSAEIYDPTTGTFSATGPLGTARLSHTATVLGSGKVLIVGGTNYGILASAELYDPTSGTFLPTGTMATPRQLHTASLLGSGKVMVAGGSGTTGNNISSAELYDPASGTFSATGTMASARYGHTASLLGSGKILLAGGFNGSAAVSSAELFDPTSGTFSPTDSMATPRGDHTASVLGSGQVLVAGGNGGGNYLSTATLYLHAIGTTCSVADDCVSGVCNGTCCSGACSGTCTTCVLGAGACTGVTNADDPDTCTGANTCDENGACKKKLGQACSTADECATAFCADGYCCDSACSGPCDVCNATPGTCTPLTGGKQGAPSCAPYVCNGAADCPNSCSSDIDCIPADYCDGTSACVPRQALGVSCSSGHECASGYCTDGVCCDTACDGQCEACDGPTPGTCSDVVGAPHGTRATCAGSGEECGACDGTDSQQCHYPAAGTACGITTCANNAVRASGCDGSGSCVANYPVPCAPYTCGSTTCKTSCINPTDCASGYVCVGGACVLPGTDAGADSGGAGAGAAGSAGASGASGTAGSASGSGGSSGGSGSSGSAGSSSSGAPGSPPASSSESGGCGCRTAPGSGEPPWLALVSLVGLAAASRRRTASNSKHRPA